MGTIGIILVAVIVVAILMGQRKGAKGAGSTSKSEKWYFVFNLNILEKKDSKKPSRSGSISSAAAIAYVLTSNDLSYSPCFDPSS